VLGLKERGLQTSIRVNWFKGTVSLPLLVGLMVAIFFAGPPGLPFEAIRVDLNEFNTARSSNPKHLIEGSIEALAANFPIDFETSHERPSLDSVIRNPNTLELNTDFRVRGYVVSVDDTGMYLLGIQSGRLSFVPARAIKGRSLCRDDLPGHQSGIERLIDAFGRHSVFLGVTVEQYECLVY